MIEYSVLELFSPFLLGYCDCRCGQELRTLTYKKTKTTRFIHGHWLRTAGRKGLDHPSYINGRIKDNQGYWRLTMPDYYCADDHGRIREHIYNFQEFHKCCMLKWGSIHHIDGNKENNMPWNLKGMTRGQHTQVHFLQGSSDRRCYLCSSNTTYLNKPRKPGLKPSFHWRHLPNDKERWVCQKCYDRLRY